MTAKGSVNPSPMPIPFNLIGKSVFSNHLSAIAGTYLEMNNKELSTSQHSSLRTKTRAKFLMKQVCPFKYILPCPKKIHSMRKGIVQRPSLDLLEYPRFSLHNYSQFQQVNLKWLWFKFFVPTNITLYSVVHENLFTVYFPSSPITIGPSSK